MSKNHIESMTDILSQFAFKKPSRANSKPPSNSNSTTLQKSTSTKRATINEISVPWKQNLKKAKLTEEKPTEKAPVREKPKAKSKKSDTSDPNFTVMEIEDEEDFNILPHTNHPTSPKKTKRGGFKKYEPEFGVEYDPENSRISLGSINLPEWTKEENIRDQNLRAPGQPEYDPTTLYIPQYSLNKMPTLMKKYWEVKS